MNTQDFNPAQRVRNTEREMQATVGVHKSRTKSRLSWPARHVAASRVKVSYDPSLIRLPITAEEAREKMLIASFDRNPVGEA